MPVNDGRYLEQSVGSILSQTLSNFELVIATDALDSGSVDLLRDCAQHDPRIRVHERDRPAGAIVTANEAVAHARAALIARMDADDIAHPDRLRRQVEVFQDRPDTVLVGAMSDGIDANGRRTRPPDRARLRRRDAFVPFPHGSAMFRRAAFDHVGGYRQACAGWEELDLFLRLAAHGRVFVLPDVLFHYRYRENSLTTGRSPRDHERVLAQQRRCIAAYRAGRSYEDLLEGMTLADSTPGGRADAYASRAAHLFWSGGRPPVWLPWRAANLRALLYGLWGAASPGTLRFVLRRWISVRDRLAGRDIGDGPYEWHFASSS